MDGLDKVNPKSLSQDNANHLTRYEKFLNEKCKVSFHFYTDKDSKQVKWRDLVGKGCFQNLTLQTCFQVFLKETKCKKFGKISWLFMIYYVVLTQRKNRSKNWQSSG